MYKSVLMLFLCVLLAGCSAPRTPESGVPAPGQASSSGVLPLPEQVGSSDVRILSVQPGSSGVAAALPDTAESPVLEAGVNELPESVFESYYLSHDAPVFEYLQHNSIKRFFHMWAEYDLGEGINEHWDYDTLAPVQLLNHNFDVIPCSDDPLYTCTFTTDDGRSGYIIVSYNEEDPSVSKWALCETTPYIYDLRAYSRKIADALAGTDIDLSTTSAARVEWIDTGKNRGDSMFLFTDGRGKSYPCVIGDGAF